MNLYTSTLVLTILSLLSTISHSSNVPQKITLQGIRSTELKTSIVRPTTPSRTLCRCYCRRYRKGARKARAECQRGLAVGVCTLQPCRKRRTKGIRCCPVEASPSPTPKEAHLRSARSCRGSHGSDPRFMLLTLSNGKAYLMTFFRGRTAEAYAACVNRGVSDYEAAHFAKFAQGFCRQAACTVRGSSCICKESSPPCDLIDLAIYLRAKCEEDD